MLTRCTLFILFSFFSMVAFAQTNYYSNQNIFSFTSPGALKYGLYGSDNPALLSTVENLNLYAAWMNEAKNVNHPVSWGIFTAVPHLGFSAVRENFLNRSAMNYKLSASAGDNELSFGFGYGWSSGRTAFFNNSDVYTLGALYRPVKHLSLGLIGNFLSRGGNEGVVDLALRPLGNEIVTLFGDYLYKKDLPGAAVNWSAGAAVEAFPGIRITGRYFEGKSFNLGAELSLGNLSFTGKSQFNSNSDRLYNIYGIRIGEYDRNPFREILRDAYYVSYDFAGETKYRRFRFFDNSRTLLNLLQQIKEAKSDKAVAGIAINISGMQMNREMQWEVREELKKFKLAGKHVVIYLDNASMSGYHFASIADKIVMDPQGIITLEGYIAGRQYYKGTLEKLGIGFTEWRYFEYKSALEAFSRDEMSEADSIQRQDLVDDFYSIARKEISESRNISYEDFDKMVNENVIFLASEAHKQGLVDSIGRWDDVKEIIKKIEGDDKGFTGASSLSKFKLPKDNYWGVKPKIAVIYALGVCAMDDGINARSLHKKVKEAAEDDDVKAIVFRVDSPGGDGLASDLVAEQLQKAKKNKPVIISQGFVAASGGYWLSMYGDTIVAAPGTITGSIGVIGGWYYNKDFKDKLGVSTDFVKRGEHADIGFGFTLPLIGITLPDRDLTDKEQQKAEFLIKDMYRDFVGKVSAGRNMKYEEVDKIGEGREWSGADALNNGLIDVLGNLNDAIDIAAKKAGLKDYDLIEMPEPPFFDFNLFMPRFFGIEIEKNSLIEDLKFRLKQNGKPMPMLPAGEYELIKY